jgi:hypothetical protein
MYLNRRIAVRVLTNQLAALSQTPADQLQAKKTVKILHALLSDKSAGANAGGPD